MTQYVALLRGINVSGKNPLTTDELAGVFRELGHGDVRTYLRTGNVVFRSDAGRQDIVDGVEGLLDQRYGVSSTVLLRSGEELAAITDGNPFLPGPDPRTLHVTFLLERPEPDRVTAATAGVVTSDEFQVRDREVYLRCPDGYGRSKLTNAFWERRLGMAATTRNWNTVTALGALALT